MSVKKGLGRGFDALVPSGVSLDSVKASKSDRVQHLAIDIVKPKSSQPRKDFNEQLLGELAHSIKEQGILQPIVVAQDEHNIYTIIAGERRWRAAQLAGLNTIPAIIKEVNDLEHLELSLIENIQRSDLNAIEMALTIDRLHQEFQQSYEQISSRLGKAYTTIVNTSRLLKLPKDYQEAIASGKISEGHARALLALNSNPAKQAELFKKIINLKLSVRQAEDFASKYKKAKVNTTSSKKGAVINKIEQQISEKLGVGVRLPKSTKKGSISIRYSNEQEYQKVIKHLLQ